MCKDARPLHAVLRFPGVLLSREVLEARLATPVARFELSRTGPACYAQINLPAGSSWGQLVELIDRVGPLVQSSMQCGEIERPSVDVAHYIEGRKVAASLLIPFAAASAIGRWGFDLKVSMYIVASGPPL